MSQSPDTPESSESPETPEGWVKVSTSRRGSQSSQGRSSSRPETPSLGPGLELIEKLVEEEEEVRPSLCTTRWTCCCLPSVTATAAWRPPPPRSALSGPTTPWGGRRRDRERASCDCESASIVYIFISDILHHSDRSINADFKQNCCFTVTTLSLVRATIDLSLRSQNCIN